MLFSSISFLYYFLPCVLIVYFIAPTKLKNVWLLLASLFFYGWGGVDFLALMMIMIGVGYAAGLLIERYVHRCSPTGAQNVDSDDRSNANTGINADKSIGGAPKKNIGHLIFGCSIVIFVVTLVYFKFAPVFPIGISFYTFQIMSYLVDVYRGEVPAQRNFVNFAAYASMFPQLVAGPIVRYTDVAKQLEKREHNPDHVAYGIRRFMCGFGKKVLIANQLGELCDIFRASGDKSVLFYWMYAAAFMFHIYFDFSGYSDMAIGLGKLFGFDFMENFNYPYISKSITEFWRRWHISLSSWFRDYVYIPLGGNRVSKKRWFFNIFVVWALTGLWHGAAWNFIAWALGFAILLVVEKLWLLPLLEQLENRVRKNDEAAAYGNGAGKIDLAGLVILNGVRHMYVLLLVALSFVMFNAQGIQDGISYIMSMFGAGDLPFTSAETMYYLRSYAVMFVLAAIGSTPIPKKLLVRIKANCIGERVVNLLEPVVLVGLLMVITAYLVDGSFNPFLYFRF